MTRPLDLSDLAAPVFVNFSARDGLPEQVLVDVRTDREGFVWAASPQGVHRYDGRRWIASDDPAMARPANNLHVDHDGTLWVGFRNHGLARREGGRWHVENAASGPGENRAPIRQQKICGGFEIVAVGGVILAGQ